MEHSETCSGPVAASKRLAILFGSGALALLLVAGIRLLQHQVFVTPGGRSNADRWLTRREPGDDGQRHLAELAPRGRLLDRRGQVLAVSYFTADLVLDPRELLHPRSPDAVSAEATAEGRHARRRALAERLVWDIDQSLALSGISVGPEERRRVHQDLMDAFGVVRKSKSGFEPVATPCPWNEVKRWLPVWRGISPIERGRVRATLSERGVRPVRFENRMGRDYPFGDAVASLLGRVYTGEHGELCGSGLEFALDSVLRERAGSVPQEVDGRGRLYYRDGLDVIPEPGSDVELTLDAHIQNICIEEARRGKEEFKSSSVSVTVLNAETGEVLALTTYPLCDYSESNSEKVGLARNSVICERFDAGSTVKPLLWAWAIDTGHARWDEYWECGGPDRVGFFGRRRVTDTHTELEPVLTETVLVHSSNVASARLVVERLGYKRTVDAFEAFGLQQAHVLAGEIGGPSVLAVEGDTFHDDPGYIRDFARFGAGPSWGQGYGVQVTPFALARAYLPFANDGSLPDPTLVKAIRTPDGTRQEVQTSRRQVISQRTAVEMRQVLGKVVSEKGGTARVLKDLPWKVGAKTGTARQAHRANNPRRNFYNPVICAIAPLARPEIVVSVLHRDIDKRVSKAYYAGSTAGPVAKRIIERTLDYLKVPHDH